MYHFSIYEVPISSYFWLRHGLCKGDVSKWDQVSEMNMWVALSFADHAAWAAKMRSGKGGGFDDGGDD